MATADSALLCAVMVRYASQARRVDQAAATLAVPEIAWTAFATVLSAAVARKDGLPPVLRPVASPLAATTHTKNPSYQRPAGAEIRADQ